MKVKIKKNYNQKNIFLQEMKGTDIYISKLNNQFPILIPFNLYNFKLIKKLQQK